MEWTEEEVKILLDNWDKPMNELTKLLPNRSYDSIAWKRKVLRRTKKYKDILNKKEREQPDLAIMKILESANEPVELSLLSEIVEIPVSEVSNILQELIDAGFDIKFDENSVYLDTKAKLVQKISNKIQTPLLLTGDWHIGSKQFRADLFNVMLDDIDDYGIKHILMNGDIVHSRAFHRSEITSLREITLTKQMESTIDLLKQIPNSVHIHGTIGNHELAIKTKLSVGFDILAFIDKTVKNFTYYGEECHLLLNGYYHLEMLHSAVGNSYATSYGLEKIWDRLEPKPDILVTGHLHNMIVIVKPEQRLLIRTGTLQDREEYLRYKAFYPILGWIIINDYDPKTNIVDYKMRVFRSDVNV